jgi:hypothetical protein
MKRRSESYKYVLSEPLFMNSRRKYKSAVHYLTASWLPLGSMIHRLTEEPKQPTSILPRYDLDILVVEKVFTCPYRLFTPYKPLNSAQPILRINNHLSTVKTMAIDFRNIYRLTIAS